MQLNPRSKTIEGDIFSAFVKAGAISKANADDPKKSSFVRCARTDKGVHAAGNVISLKLIIEDPDIINKINDNLPPQIRIWGVERTTGSFSCYQACDSRWYEYLIPTHSFLPPHPTSYLGKKLVELAEEAGDFEDYKRRQEEVAEFWEKTETERIKPILDGLDEGIRDLVEHALYHFESQQAILEDDEEGSIIEELVDGVETAEAEDGTAISEEGGADIGMKDEPQPDDDEPLLGRLPETSEVPPNTTNNEALTAAVKTLKAAYIVAKRRWRIPQSRLDRVIATFAAYKGTKNFHNYTVRKSFNDPSIKRHILSFRVSETPIIINDTEWLSLKVHGQSFMMHQIRKMVGMAALIVRCGTDIARLKESFGPALMSIPKAPALGLLLEKPVFDSYNLRATTKFERGRIEFDKFDQEIEDFKKREIYERIFREEEREHVFHSFFSHIDNYKVPVFLFVTSKGMEACGGVGRDPSTAQPALSRKQRSQGAVGKRRHGKRRESDDVTKGAVPDDKVQKSIEHAENEMK